MTALDDKLAEQDRIKAELQRMEDDDSVSEETDGDLRDTLVKRWKELDRECKPIISRMAEIRQITRAAATPGATEDGSDPGPAPRKWGKDGPDLVVRTERDPYDDLNAVRSRLVTRTDLKARALDAIEVEARRANLTH